MGKFQKDKLFLKIVQKQVGWITTLKTRNRDVLDFHEISVKSLERMLNEAFEAGRDFKSNGVDTSCESK